jgi:hypothetical protein
LPRHRRQQVEDLRLHRHVERRGRLVADDQHLAPCAAQRLAFEPVQVLAVERRRSLNAALPRSSCRMPLPRVVLPQPDSPTR